MRCRTREPPADGATTARLNGLCRACRNTTPSFTQQTTTARRQHSKQHWQAKRATRFRSCSSDFAAGGTPYNRKLRLLYHEECELSVVERAARVPARHVDGQVVGRRIRP